MLDMGLWYRGGILAERSLRPSRFGKSNIQEPSLSSHTKINQLDFLIISLQHSGCAAKLSWSTDFVFPPIYTGTSKTGYNIPPRLGAARAFSFVKTDRCKIRPESRAKRVGSHRIPVLLSKFSASQIAKAWNKMNLHSPVRSEGHLDRMQRRAGVTDQGEVLNKKHPRKQSHLARSKGTVPLYTQYEYSSKTLSKVHINFSSRNKESPCNCSLPWIESLHKNVFLGVTQRAVPLSHQHCPMKAPPASASRSQGLTSAEADHCHTPPPRLQFLTPQNAFSTSLLLLLKALLCELSLQASIKKMK